jgi:hypothetical protein
MTILSMPVESSSAKCMLTIAVFGKRYSCVHCVHPNRKPRLEQVGRLIAGCVHPPLFFEAKPIAPSLCQDIFLRRCFFHPDL